MDRHLKERLIGAAVLVAAAIIFIPEMLSGPHEGIPFSESTPSETNGVKTYTIDLANNNSASSNAKGSASDSTATQSTMEFAPAPVPAHDIPTTAELNEGARAEAAARESAKNESAVNASAPGPSQSAPAATQASKSESPVDKSAKVANSETVKPEKSEPRQDDHSSSTNSSNSKPIVSAGGGWAVQVASFGQKPTADRIASELKAKGFSAFVTSTAVKNQTMYRVRVGPVADRPAAEALLTKVKAVHPNAAVVTQ